MSGAAYPRREEVRAQLAASPVQVFALFDDHRRLALHMEGRSPMMAGASMRLEMDERQGRGVGARIRMNARVLGIALSLDEAVTEYEPPRRKVWQTLGEPRLLVIGAYRMGFELAPAPAGTEVRLWIDYDLPRRGLPRLLGLLLGRVYARWCTAQMMRAGRERFAAGALQ